MLDISNIKIVGIGGAGLSILENIATKLPEIPLVAIDTDARALENSSIERKILLVENGEGTGGDSEIARKIATEKSDELASLFLGTRMMIVVAGFGGGTGSVVSSMLSNIAERNPECELLAFATLPLDIEGEEKIKLSKKAQAYMSRRRGALFTLPNDIILAKQNLPIAEAYAAANDCVSNVVSAAVISATSRGIVNIDFPTFVKIFSTNDETKTSFAAFGRGNGENAVEDAIAELAQSPLLPKDFKARTMLLSLRCPKSFEMNKMQMLLESASKTFGQPQRFAFGAIAETSFSEHIEVCAMGLCDIPQSQNESTTSQNIGADSPPQTNTSSSEQSSDNATLSNEVETEPQPQEQPPRRKVEIAPPIERIDVSVKPVPVKPERRSFFGFGRKSKSRKKISEEMDKQQTQFKFMELSEQRGFFLDTPPNIRNGEDLDVPTYLRRNIEINL